jgi:hypothetical protein
LIGDIWHNPFELLAFMRQGELEVLFSERVATTGLSNPTQFAWQQGLQDPIHLRRFGWRCWNLPMTETSAEGENVCLTRSTYLILPIAAPIPGELLLPAIWLGNRVWRRSRARDNCCPVCGYDLRATPERCPECGRIAADQTMQSGK